MNKICVLFLLLGLAAAGYAPTKVIIQSDPNDYEEETSHTGGHYQQHYKPHPYQFGYNIKDHDSNSYWHKEEGDAHGTKKGSYGYTDAHGVYRHVEYVADHAGFRAKIKTNEHGTANQNPANVVMHAEEPPYQPVVQPVLYKQAQEHDQQYTYIPVHRQRRT